MVINDNLNIVIPVRSDDKGPTVYAYHTPISREVFAQNYRIIAATKSALESKGIHYLMGSGPRIASLALRDAGKEDAEGRDGPSDGGVSSLLMEMARLTTILAPGPSGWAQIPIDAAIAQNTIDADDWQEAESALVFFTSFYALSRKTDQAGVAKATASALKGSITSLPAMEFIASLPTSTTAATSVPKVVSSLPV